VVRGACLEVPKVLSNYLMSIMFRSDWCNMAVLVKIENANLIYISLYILKGINQGLSGQNEQLNPNEIYRGRGLLWLQTTILSIERLKQRWEQKAEISWLQKLRTFDLGNCPFALDRRAESQASLNLRTPSKTRKTEIDFIRLQ
jgi:hypothetical protein